jgi:hypothetical protein
MINELVDLLPNFPGPANHSRCFLHIVNLVAKTLLRQFEVPKKEMNTALDAAEQALLDLSTGTDMEELVTVAEGGLGDDNDADDIDGWVNEMDKLSEEEGKELRQKIQPVRLVLVKVKNDSTLRTYANGSGPQLRKLAFKILHSTTKLLPAWRSHLKDLKMRNRIMPRDVATRWNSTFDMLEFALEYRKALDAISGDRDMDLRQFELDEFEWKIAAQLRDALKVRNSKFVGIPRFLPSTRF